MEAREQLGLPMRDEDAKLFLEAQQAMQEVQKVAVMATRRIGANYPYFIVYGLAVLLSYSSGQYVSVEVLPFTTGMIWLLLAPICAYIAFRWQRAESVRDGVVRREKPSVEISLWYFEGILTVVGLVLTFFLVSRELVDYIFPMWVLLTAIILALWGMQVSAAIVGLGIFNLFASVAVIAWLLDYRFIILSLTMGGGNLLVGLVEWWMLKSYRQKRDRKREQGDGATA